MKRVKRVHAGNECTYASSLIVSELTVSPFDAMRRNSRSEGKAMIGLLFCVSFSAFMMVHHVPDSKVHGATWGPSGADRTQVGSMLAPWTLLSGLLPAEWQDVAFLCNAAQSNTIWYNGNGGNGEPRNWISFRTQERHSIAQLLGWITWFLWWGIGGLYRIMEYILCGGWNHSSSHPQGIEYSRNDNISDLQR